MPRPPRPAGANPAALSPMPVSSRLQHQEFGSEALDFALPLRVPLTLATFLRDPSFPGVAAPSPAETASSARASPGPWGLNSWGPPSVMSCGSLCLPLLLQFLPPTHRKRIPFQSNRIPVWAGTFSHTPSLRRLHNGGRGLSCSLLWTLWNSVGSPGGYPTPCPRQTQGRGPPFLPQPGPGPGGVCGPWGVRPSARGRRTTPRWDPAVLSHFWLHLLASVPCVLRGKTG